MTYSWSSPTRSNKQLKDLTCIHSAIYVKLFNIQETLHMPELHKVSCPDSLENLECAHGSDEKEDTGRKRKTDSTGSLLMNWPLMSSIMVYCVFSLHDMAYTEVR